MSQVPFGSITHVSRELIRGARIYQLEKTVNQPGTQAQDSEAAPLIDNDDPDAVFRRALDQELDKICSFYQLKELEIFAELEEILNDLETFVKETEHVDPGQLDGATEQFNHQRRASLFSRVSFAGRKRRPSMISASTIDELDEDSDEDPNERSALGDSGLLSERRKTVDATANRRPSLDDLRSSSQQPLARRKTVQTIDEYGDSESALDQMVASSITLKKRTVSIYVSVCELKSFVQLNKTGFSKVLKKYDKILDRALKKPYLKEKVDPAPPFVSSTIRRLDESIKKVETAYANLITKGDEDEARRELRLHLREHVVWERNTVWREMIGVERKAQAVNLGVRRTLLDHDPAKIRRQGDEHYDMHAKEVVTPIGRYRCPTWLWSSTFAWLIVILAIFFVLLFVPIMKKPEQQNCLAMLVLVSALWATEVRTSPSSSSYAQLRLTAAQVIPLFVTSLLVPFLAVILQVVRDDRKPHSRLTPPEAAKYVFASMWTPVIMLLLGGFTIAAALSKFQIAKLLATFVLSKAGTRPRTVLLTNMFVALILSMWISNVASPVLCFSIIQVSLPTIISEKRKQITDHGMLRPAASSKSPDRFQL